MKKIELVKGIESSILGFGCAPILGSEGGSRSKKAIECAIDCGINHFDVARSYGYGESEQFLGKVLGARRKNMIIASKFGIKPNFKAKLLRPIKPIVRYLKNETKGKIIRSTELPKNSSLNVADTFLYRTKLNKVEMQKSIEESLRALKTDYLDYFFIHEPLQTIVNIDEIADCAYEFKKAGKIRAWGIAYMYSQEHLHKNYIDSFDILQFNVSPDEIEYKKMTMLYGHKSNIIFSPLKGAHAIDKTPSERLLTLSKDYTSSIILCSMFSESHIKANSLLFS